VGGIYLFGRFQAVTRSGESVPGLQARKVQELLSYLLLSKNRPVQRERLAEELWPDVDGQRSKKYLRQALWQLQRTTEAMVNLPERRLLTVEQDWISTSPHADVWVDVIEFDRVYEWSVNAPTGVLGPDLRKRLQDAVSLYRGELLEGWYADWTTHYQDVYRSIYLLMLDKLMMDAELSGQWEVGLGYGRKALQLDRGNERVHVHMMRLHCMAGDRTAALRQFATCVEALREELDVEPERDTTKLYELIREEGAVRVGAELSRPGLSLQATPANSNGREVLSLGSLRDLNRTLNQLQEQVVGQIQALERSTRRA
jgi:DNA-binding SARP family transcriptional activator